MPDTPSVLVIILNWNGEIDSIEAIQSVQSQDYTNYHILLVDNGSRADSLDAIRRSCPDIECLATGQNLGYAGGNNAGLREGIKRNADCCLVLNNDMTIAPDMLRILMQAMEHDASLAICGPRVFRHDQPDTLFYTGWEIDWKRWLFHRIPAPLAQQPVAAVDYIQGCAMLMRTSFLRQHGCFDERFHLYCEDADLCVRATRSGYKVAEVMAAKAWHKGYGSSGKQSPLKIYYGLRNRLLFISKHAPRQNRLVLRAQLLLGDAGTQALQALRMIMKSDKAKGYAILRAIACATRDWLLGRYGSGPEWLFERPGDKSKTDGAA